MAVPKAYQTLIGALKKYMHSSKRSKIRVAEKQQYAGEYFGYCRSLILVARHWKGWIRVNSSLRRQRGGRRLCLTAKNAERQGPGWWLLVLGPGGPVALSRASFLPAFGAFWAPTRQRVGFPKARSRNRSVCRLQNIAFLTILVAFAIHQQ